MQKEIKTGNEYCNDLETRYLERMRTNLLKYYQEELGLSDVERRIQTRINRERGKYHIKLAKLVDIKNKTLLDVGSGWGEYVIEAHKMGAIAHGIEPDEDRLETSSAYYKDCTFKRGYAEYIPFEDNFFDIIICCYVLEHISNVKKSIQEMIRVLKPGGILYLAVPNYLYPYEGH